MTRYRLARETHHETFPDDVDRMERVLAAHGHTAPRSDLDAAWRLHSDGYAAGWVSLPDDDAALLAHLMALLEEDPTEAD